MPNNRSPEDFDSEIESHIAHEADRLISSGMSPSEARTAARRAFGNVTGARERFRESNRWLWWDQLTQDVRYAGRTWRKRPWLTAVVIISLALGIGANTAIFSVVNTLLLEDLPYLHADRLLYVTELWPHEPMVPGPPSPDFANWRDNSRLAEAIAAYGGGATLTLTGTADPERVQGTVITHNLLPMIGTTLALGRSFTPEEDRLGGPPVVILGNRLWQRHFGGSASALGQTVTLNGVARTIVGVLPAGFQFPDNNFREELLVPMALPADPNWRDERNFRLLRVLVRARTGVQPSALQQEFSQLIGATAVREPVQMVTMRKDMEVRVTPLREWLTGTVRRTVLILEGAVALLLFIACLNVAALQSALAIARRQEMGLRTALGAGAGRLIKQLLTESLILSLLAASLGVAFAYAGLGGLRKFLPANLHLADGIGLDARVLLFTFLLTFAVAVCSGLIPAFVSSRARVSDVLQDGNSRLAGARDRQRLSSALIVLEVSAAIVLLAGSGLLIRTFVRLATAGAGFDPRGVLTLRMAPSARSHPNPESRVRFYRRLLESAQTLPGVEIAAVGNGLPLVGSAIAAGVSFEGKPLPPLGGRPTVPVTSISPDYFRLLGVNLLRGRTFAEPDNTGSVLTAIVNRAFADEFFPGENALGKRIEVGSREGRWREIVGIVDNVRQEGRRPLDRLAIYLPLADFPDAESFLILKSPLRPEQLAASAARMVHGVDPNAPVFDVATMEDRLGETLSRPRSIMTLMSFFAALAFVLVTVGIFGVTAYFVGRRRHEIAVRMALGATRSNVLRMVFRRSMAVVVVGIILGVAGSVALSRTLVAAVEGVRPDDPATYASVALIFLAVAAGACLIPAAWAARLDPAAALRMDT